MKNKIRVGIIFGGRSGEHEVSIVSAASVINALDKAKYEAVTIYINKKGQWLFGAEPKHLKGRGAEYVYLPPDPTAKGLLAIKTSKKLPRRIDVIFPVLHGPFGEDGTVQGLLELAGIPYVGAGVAASAVGMDKALMKKVFEAALLPVLKYLVFLRKEVESNVEKVTEEVEKELDYPVFVKPANLGSSVGITKAHNRIELIEGLKTACQYDRKVVVEQGIDRAREIEVAVLGNDDPQASICGEVAPSREFYDYEDKYILNKAKLLIPAKISQQQSEEIREMAVQAFKATDCAGMARVDFFIDRKTNQVFIDEVNTIPGFTAVSMYPKLWQASGVSYSDLISRLIDLAIARYDDKIRSITNFPSKLLR
jgi:D-alanine-D-alanine ligase